MTDTSLLGKLRNLSKWLDDEDDSSENHMALLGDLVTPLPEIVAALERDAQDAARINSELATLRTQLATMTAGRDALQTSMNELRKTCAEIIGADPQTWPDHGNAPLAIAACLGLRDAELQKTTAERDAALAKVAVLREALGLIHMRSARWSPSHCLARNALEATK